MEKIAIVRGEEQTPLQLAQHYGQVEAAGSLQDCLASSYLIIMLQARLRGKLRRRREEKRTELAQQEHAAFASS